MHAMCTLLEEEVSCGGPHATGNCCRACRQLQGAMTPLCLHCAGGKPRFIKGAYVLGKIVWGKGEQLSAAAADCLAPRLSTACMGLSRHG